MDKAGFRTMRDGADSYMEHRASGEHWQVKLVGKTYCLRVRVRVGQTVGGVDDMEDVPHLEAASSSAFRHPPPPPALKEASVAVQEDPQQAGQEPPSQIAISPRHSPIEVLRARLKELKAPIWGTKAQMHDRLMLVEAKKAAEDRTRAELEAKHVKLAEGTTDRMAAVLPAPEMPSPSEVANHNLTHLPRAKWCITCQLGGSNDDPHRLTPFVNKEKARLQWDFMHMKSHDSQCEWLLDEPPSNEWNVILTAIDEDSGCRLAVVLSRKTVEDTYGCE